MFCFLFTVKFIVGLGKFYDNFGEGKFKPLREFAHRKKYILKYNEVHTMKSNKKFNFKKNG